jgi:hypothetical protein
MSALPGRRCGGVRALLEAGVSAASRVLVSLGYDEANIGGARSGTLVECNQSAAEVC